MLEREKEQVGIALRQFVTACRQSLGLHVAGVLEFIPKEDLDALDEEGLVLMLSAHVAGDVMGLGLQIMCWRMVTHTVDEVIIGMVTKVKENLRERAKEESAGSEEAESLS